MKLHFDSVKGNLKKCNIMANIFRKSTQDKMILVIRMPLGFVVKKKSEGNMNKTFHNGKNVAALFDKLSYAAQALPIKYLRHIFDI